MRASIDVVILTWNDGELLAQAVESALASRDADVHVIVVDNGSDTPAHIPEDPRVELVRNEANLGVARGRNQGVRAGSAPLVCLLDSDARLEPTTLAALAAQFKDSRVALAAPVMVGQAPEASAGKAPTVARKAARALNLTASYAAAPRRLDQPAWDVDFAIGACQLIRRSAFGAVGGLDETYFYGPEDVDLCLRLKEAGWRVVQVAAAVCEHPPRRRFKKVLTRRGAQHAVAVARHLWRHRQHRARPGRVSSWRPSTSS